MDYQFPRIEHLDDVLPAIEERDEFVVATREWGIVVNYMVSMADTFPPVQADEYWCPGCKLPMDETVSCGSQRCPEPVNLAAIRRECRGLLFYPDGRIMSRRLHKFFNVGERDETAAHKIDLSRPHVILEKLDGSMITPVVTDAGVRWGTKMGITDVSMGAEEFVAKHVQYADFAREVLSEGKSPIFEWCSRRQRIVVDYPRDRLVLIAIRDNVTGEYVGYNEMVNWAHKFGVEAVGAYAGTAANMEHLISETRAAEGIEGWIIRFDDGQMLKIKGDWYVRIHKTKDSLTLEKNVVDLIVNEKIDDVKAFMLDDDRARVEAFEAEFWKGFSHKLELYDNYWQMVQKSVPDRKTYAQTWMPTIQKQDSFAPQFVFGKYDGKDSRKMILDQIRKNTGTQTKIDSVRHLWDGAQWNYHFDGDA